jgi:hypothetical protein
MFFWVLESITILKNPSHFEHFFFDLLLGFVLIFREEDGLYLGVTLQSVG